MTYTSMNVGDILKNMAETYNSLLEKARVPVEAWQTGKTFYVRDETAVISGAIDRSGVEESNRSCAISD